MFGPFTNQSENLLSLYLMFFKISFYKDRKKAEKNIDILFSTLNETLDVTEWNHALKELAKAWKTEAPEVNGIVNIKLTKQNLINKILCDNEEKGQQKLMKLAERNTRVLFKNDSD